MRDEIRCSRCGDYGRQCPTCQLWEEWKDRRAAETFMEDLVLVATMVMWGVAAVATAWAFWNW